MNRRARHKKQAGGFTLVELVTALAIIALLLALLVPAFTLISNKALQVRQQGQFNRIEVALEGYRADFGDYPPSSMSRLAPGDPWYVGAQKVAENIRIFFDQTKLKTAESSKNLGTVTVSIGAAHYRPSEPLEEFVFRADQALYFAKNAGRNCVATESDLASSKDA